MTALLALLAFLLQPLATLDVTVTSAGVPLQGARVVAGGETRATGADGRAAMPIPPGEVLITVIKDGFVPVTLTVTAVAEATTPVTLALEPQEPLEEVVTVSATRTGARLDDQPMRVEVLGLEDIEEKQLMTPGDIVMMLNEMGGLRVQTTSPSLGAASVRVQGMRGRYTRFFSDVLPLFGTSVGGFGLLQIPPSDLGQVEVIKGVASALYGAGALGGVVDLISRRPSDEPVRDVLVNRTTRGGTDAVLFAGQRFSEQWGGTLLVGAHGQERNDLDDDGWSDLARYERGVIRPRLFWDDGAGRSLFATAGVMTERRLGGTLPGRLLAATGAPFLESLDTTRLDAGFVLQTPVASTRIMTVRFSATQKQTGHEAGDLVEDRRQRTVFTEVALRGSAPRQTWVAGTVFERSTLDPANVPQFAFTYNVPGVFVQDDVTLARWMIASVSARLDRHCLFGWFASPRGSVLVRGGPWSGRLSIGTGFFAPSALTEETEAAGLTRLTIPQPLRAERGRSVSADLSHTRGPLTLTATAFRYHVRDPVVVDRDAYALVNVSDPTVTYGLDTVALVRREPVSVTATYTYVRSQEGSGPARADIPLTPRHSAGVVVMWEKEGSGRVGFEAYYTGRQRLEDNPYRSSGTPFVLFGGLIERRVGPLRLFVNVENLADVRQTRNAPLVRPSRAADGRWTVDAWTPLDGRVLNGGVRWAF